MTPIYISFKRYIPIGSFLGSYSRILAFFVLSALLIISSCGEVKKTGDGPGPDQCATGMINVNGEAPIFSSVSAARSKAKEDACRSAVEKCIGSTISARSGVADGQSIGSQIFDEAKGICRDWEILDESQYSLDTVKMLKLTMRYKVEPAKLDSTINTLQAQIGNPKVMVLIREEYNINGKKKIINFSSPNGKSGSLLREFLVSKGYTVIDGSRILQNKKFGGGSPDELSDEIKDLAADAGADVIIIGSLQSLPQNETVQGIGVKGIKSYRATGSVSILTLWGRGKILGEYTKSVPGAQFTDSAAAEKAISTFAVGNKRNKVGGLAEFVHDRLSSEWSAITRNNIIYVTISGLDRATAGLFRDDLTERTSVKNVSEINFIGNKAEWEVTYPGRSFALSDTIDFYSNDPRMFLAVKESGKKIRVLSVKRGEVHLAFE